MKKVFIYALTVLLLVSMLAVDAGAYAVDLIFEVDSQTKKPTDEIDYEATVAQYLSLEFATAEEKLETMEMMMEKDGYQLWVDELTGEVATKDLASGQILFSNPYDIGAAYPAKKGPSDSTKKKIMSQVMIRYVDNDTEKEFYSFEESAMRGQIKIKNIKNGIRVEYSIGREETRMLVPKVIERERFETVILDSFAAEINEISAESGLVQIEWRDYNQLTKRTQAIYDSGNSLWFNFNQLRAYYLLKAADNCATAREKASLYAAYPICKKMDVYVFATDSTNTETMRIENYIKTYVPTYTYEQLEYDHNITEYEGSDKNPALFKMALEYSLDKWGMTVRLPVNGLRFDESLYQLVYISVLPYMGAGGNYLLGKSDEKFTGFNFFPDGSGTLFRHEDLATGNTTTINAKVYGMDFAYNNITGSHTEVVRYPVFGIVSNYHDIRTQTEKQLVTEEMRDPTTGELIAEAEYEDVETEYTYNEDRGFVAVIEEGDALAELSTYHAGSLSKYNTINMLFYPRPKDSYNLANAISVGANATWTVVSSRKYVGNYKIRYIMLTDDTIAREKGIEKYYSPTWMGMASAYRDYLYSTGDLSALEQKDIKEDIPAYIETFGTIETQEKIMSLPVDVMTPLSSFEDIKTMYDELSAAGVGNIKFKLTGYANGGMFASIPYNLKWEKAVGGKKGYTDLVNYANEKGFQVFPDFDFAYVRSSTNTMFDGLRLKQHIVKSINNTYMSRRYYSATRQTMFGRYELAVSSAYYAHFYEKLSENLSKYYEDGVRSTISVGTLGTALNSDFDEDEPYNREDSKASTIEAVAALSEKFDDVMTEGANAYTWKYVDYIVNTPLDSSRYTRSSASVPFIGVVLHGSKQFAGTPLNMEGNIGYSLLKAIENGSGVYFVLCYQNYAKLKENMILSQYYSVRYDILKDDIVRYYKLVNDLTKDLQLTLISSHEFLIGERIPDADEIEADKEAAARALAEELAAAAEAEEKARIASLLNGRVYASDNSDNYLTQVKGFYEQAIANDVGACSVAVNGNVTVTKGMKTLVNEVIAANEVKADAQKKNDEKLHEKEFRAAILEAWTEIYNPFSKFMTSSANGIYAGLLNTLERSETTLANNRATLETRKTNYETAKEKAYNDGIAEIAKLLEAYKASPTDENLTALTTVSGNVADAERYVALTGEIKEADAALAAFKTAYLTSEEYTTLNAAKKAADEAYKAAQAADSAKTKAYETTAAVTDGKTEAEVAEAQAYVAAKKALTDAQAELKTRTTVVKTMLTSSTKALADLSEGSDEYVELQKLIAEATVESEALADPANTTNPYTAAVISAQAALDAFTPDSASAKAAADAADKALKDYVANYAETYTTSHAYVAAENSRNAKQAELENLEAKFRSLSPLEGLVKAFSDAYEKRLDLQMQRSALETGYYATAEYKRLKNEADAATLALDEVTAKLTAAKETDSDYLRLTKTLEEKQKALEVFTLEYQNSAAYEVLKGEVDKYQAELDELSVSYESSEDYKKLKAAFDAAEADYEAKSADILGAAEGKSFTLTDAYRTSLKSSMEKYAEAKAALEIYVDAATLEITESDDYKKAASELEKAQKAEQAFIDNFQAELDAAADASRSEEKPEETTGGKYAIALDEYKTAQKYLDFFEGKTSVPASVKDAVVFSEKIKTNSEYVAANSAKTKAADALLNYTVSYTSGVKATSSSSITDAGIKEANAKYAELTAAYNAANDELNAATADMRAFSPALFSSLNTYYTSVTTVRNAELTVENNSKILDVSNYKAKYENDNKTFSVVAEEFNAATEASKTADTEFTAAASELTKATKTTNDSIKNVKNQISRITTTIIPRLNYYVSSMKQTLSDSNYALEQMSKSPDYSDALKADLLETNKKVVAVEAEVRKYSDETVKSAKHALETASAIVATDIEVADPYNPDSTVPVPGDDPEGEEGEADEGYEYTKYTDDSGNIVAVGYANGVSFIINYNFFDVTVVRGEKTYTIPACGGIRINADGTEISFNAADIK